MREWRKQVKEKKHNTHKKLDTIDLLIIMDYIMPTLLLL